MPTNWHTNACLLPRYSPSNPSLEEAAVVCGGRGSYGSCGRFADPSLLGMENWSGSEDSLSFGQEQRVSGRGLYTGVSGWFTAVMVDRNTKAGGVNDSVRVGSMGQRLGRVKPNPLVNPLVYKLGSVPGGKRLRSRHSGATLRTREACGEMGNVGSRSPG